MRHDPDVAFQMRVEANRKKLRDQFAMAALPGLINQGLTSSKDGVWNHRSIADEAYTMADAMLEARDDTRR